MLNQFNSSRDDLNLGPNSKKGSVHSPDSVHPTLSTETESHNLDLSSAKSSNGSTPHHIDNTRAEMIAQTLKGILEEHTKLMEKLRTHAEIYEKLDPILIKKNLLDEVDQVLRNGKRSDRK